MKKRQKTVAGVGAAAGMALLLSGCFPGGGGGGDGDTDSLAISLAFTPLAGWPVETFESADILNQIGCGESLTRFNAETEELEPLLATEWEQVEPTVWEFTLREDVTFQDGSEFNADAVVGSLQHLLDATTPPGSFSPDSISGVEAVDAGTVRITTPEESAFLPLRVASTNTVILSPDAYGEDGSIDILGACTGPYTAVNETPTQSVTLEANEDYWGDAPSIANIEAKFFPDGQTRATQVRTGESQISLVLPVGSLAELEGDDEINVTRTVIPRTTGLYFNTEKAPFDNPDVRRAIQQAIDTQAVIDSIYDGVGAAGMGPFAADYAWAPDVEPVQADAEAAKQLLADAGIAEGELTVELIAYTERPEFGDLAAVIQEQLAEIGITVEIRAGDYASVESDLMTGNFDMSLLSRNQLTSIADPAAYLEADYLCDGSYNISQFCDPEMDAAINDAIGILDSDERYAAYADIAEQLQEEAVTVFLVHEEQIAANRSNVTGFVDDPMNRYAITTELAYN